MKKRLISIILVLVMCSSLCVFASAAESKDSKTRTINANGTSCKIWSTVFENRSTYRGATWIQTWDNSYLPAGSARLQSYLYDNTGTLATSSESTLPSDYYFHVAYTEYKTARYFAFADGTVWVKNSSGGWDPHGTEQTPVFNFGKAAMLESAASTLENGRYPQNDKGMTYGSLAVANVAGEAPELIAAMGTNGKNGYIQRTDLLEEYDEEKYAGSVGRDIPIYDLDGNQIDTFVMYFNDTAEISGMDIDEVREKLADGRSENPILWDLADKTLVNGAYPTNRKGETYGHPMLRKLVGYLPDLVASTNEVGIHGYIRNSDVPVTAIDTDGNKTESQPLYDKEGKVIGTFQVGGGNTANFVGKTISAVYTELSSK